MEFDIGSHKSCFLRTGEGNGNYLKIDAYLCRERNPAANLKPEMIMYSEHEPFQTHRQN